MFSLLATLALSPAHADSWKPLTCELEDTLNGIRIQTTEVDGWIQRTAGGNPHGDVELHSMEKRSMPRPSSRALPSAPPPSPMMELEPSVAPAMDEGGYAMGPKGGALPQQQGPLKAGTTDDNEAFGEFLEFLATWTDRPGVAGNHIPMEVAGRQGIRVRGADGSPLPGAHVSVTRGGRTIWNGTTYGDGRAPFFPGITSGEAGDTFQVQVQHDGVATRATWNGAEPLSLSLDHTAKSAMQLDVVFVIDTTGSMADEIDRIKQTLLSVTAKVQELDRPVDLRYGAVLYRDIGDQYLTRHTPLTRDLKGFDGKIQQIEAGGGGDGPESYNQGLAVAVSEMDWRQDAAKLMFVVADAPPHMDYESDTDYAKVSKAALSQGIRIHTVAASGLDDFGSLVFRQTSQLTQGRFIFIEYGSTAASAADHGVTGPVQSNNLDAILYRQISHEVEGWGENIVAMR